MNLNFVALSASPQRRTLQYKLHIMFEHDSIDMRLIKRRLHTINNISSYFFLVAISISLFCIIRCALRSAILAYIFFTYRLITQSYHVYVFTYELVLHSVHNIFFIIFSFCWHFVFALGDCQLFNQVIILFKSDFFSVCSVCNYFWHSATHTEIESFATLRLRSNEIVNWVNRNDIYSGGKGGDSTHPIQYNFFSLRLFFVFVVCCRSTIHRFDNSSKSFLYWINTTKKNFFY